MLIHRRLLPRPGPARRDLCASIAAGVAGGAIVVGQAALVAGIVADVFLDGAELPDIVPALVGLSVLAAGRWLAHAVSELTARRAAAAVKADLRIRLAAAAIARGPASLADAPVGELATAIGPGLEPIDAYVGQFLPQAALAALVPLGVLVVVAVVDPLSAVVLVVTFPLIPLFMYLVGSSADSRARAQWTELLRLGARFFDALEAMPTLRAFGRAESEVATTARCAERFRALTMNVLRLAFVSALVLELLATLGTAVVAVEVGLRLLFAKMAFVDAFFVLLVTPEFYRPLRALGAAFHAGMAGREAAVAVDRWGPVDTGAGAVAPEHQVEKSRPGTIEIAPWPAPRPTPPAITFEQVRVNYSPSRPPALAGISFEVAPGTTTAIVGTSGAGKSTIVSLLLRFLSPSAGTIRIDGLPLDGIDAEHWRTHVAWVPQAPHLFHGTLRENVLVARPDASEDEWRRAVALARVDEFVARLPNGWETQVGERGARLSGGQRQRVALARAFLRDAPLVVLDEPTAELDAGHEAEVAEALSTLRRGRTCVLVAHRLSTIAEADDLVVLDRGGIVEQGRPADLLRRDAVYARLVRACESA